MLKKRWKFNEKEDIYIVSLFPKFYIVITKEKIITYQWENLVDTMVAKLSKLTLLAMEQSNISYVLMGPNDKNTSFVLDFCQVFINWSNARKHQINSS